MVVESSSVELSTIDTRNEFDLSVDYLFNEYRLQGNVLL